MRDNSKEWFCRWICGTYWSQVLRAMVLCKCMRDREKALCSCLELGRQRERDTSPDFLCKRWLGRWELPPFDFCPA